MNTAVLQKRIDEISWYHEFDFGNGLRSRSSSAHPEHHRATWAFLRGQLDRIDFRGKTVLDIGCWDGYWSFYAEQRGAKAVLATDDISQNWAGRTGVHLAKELLNSNVEINLRQSVYDLAALGRKFDIVLFLGVYYHLHAPFQAFAQVRHCCHPGTTVLVDGPVTHGLEPGAARYDFADHSCEWLPTLDAVRQIADATYFDVPDHALMSPPEVANPEPAEGGKLGWRYRLRLATDALRGGRRRIMDRVKPIAPPTRGPREAVNRLFMKLSPRAAAVKVHDYPPPFGLGAYDPRFRAAA